MKAQTILSVLIVGLMASGRSEAESLAQRIQNLHSWTDLVAFADVHGSDREYVLKKIRTNGTLAPFPRIRWNGNFNIISVDHETFELHFESEYPMILWRQRLAMFNPFASPRENIDLVTRTLLNSKSSQARNVTPIPLFFFKIVLLQLPLTHENAKADFTFGTDVLTAVLSTFGIWNSPTRQPVRRLTRAEMALDKTFRVHCSEFDTPKKLSFADFADPIFESTTLNDAYVFCKTQKPPNPNCAAAAQTSVLTKITKVHAWRLRTAADGSLFKVQLRKSEKGEPIEGPQAICPNPLCKELSARLNRYCANPNSQENKDLEGIQTANANRFASLPFVDPPQHPPNGLFVVPRTDGAQVIQ